MQHRRLMKLSTLGATLSATALAVVMASQQGQAGDTQQAYQCEDPVAVSVLVVEAKQPKRIVEDKLADYVLDLPMIPEKKTKSYTEAELEMMALVIYQEAGGDACTDETRLMVGQVVLNRVADSRFPDTIEEVLLQKSQYGRLHWTGLVWPERASNETEREAVERAYKCAEMVLDGEKLLPDDVIFQSEFVQGKEIVAQSDGFYFCR